VLTGGFFLVQQMMEMKVAEQVREAETRRLVRQMGGGQPTWLIYAARWLLCYIGRTLVSLGQWLQRSAAPRARTLESAAPLGHE
jgi:hypothetical protein